MPRDAPRPTPGRPAFTELPLGDVRPAGWLRSQLLLQAAGHTGRLAAVWPDVGSSSAWLGGDGEDWERGPYFLDGLVPLAHVLDDADLLAQAQTWVTAILAGQRADGQFGPESNDDWWPRMVALKVLTQHADATGDPAVPEFLARYFRYQAAELPHRPLMNWGRVRGADNVLSVLWLHGRTGDPSLLDLAELLLEQTADWHGHLVRDLPEEPTRSFTQLNHSVNVAMGIKSEAVRWLLDGDDTRRERSTQQLEALGRLHGMVHGTFSGDEWLAGRDPHHGVETCLVVEQMFSLQQMVRIFGNGELIDTLELLAYNLLPAACDPEMLSHQYLQQANQVRATVEARDWTYSSDDANIFGLEPHFGCCTANLHQGWPKLVRSLWMATPDGGLAALSYAPCTVRTVTPQGQRLEVDVETQYPFEEEVRITVRAPGTFPVRLRVPAWCTSARLTVAGQDVGVDVSGWVVVQRTWTAGDVIQLTLPMTVRTVPRDRGAVGVRLGPLVLAASPGENWQPVPNAPGLAEWQVLPRTSWNRGLLLHGDDGESRLSRWSIRRQPVGEVPFTLAAAPVEVWAQGARVRAWGLQQGSAGPVPDSPVISDQPLEQVRLVPYGNARLRITEFPVIVPARSGMKTI